MIFRTYDLLGVGLLFRIIAAINVRPKGVKLEIKVFDRGVPGRFILA